MDSSTRSMREEDDRTSISNTDSDDERLGFNSNFDRVTDLLDAGFIEGLCADVSSLISPLPWETDHHCPNSNLMWETRMSLDLTQSIEEETDNLKLAMEENGSLKVGLGTAQIQLKGEVQEIARLRMELEMIKNQTVEGPQQILTTAAQPENGNISKRQKISGPPESQVSSSPPAQGPPPTFTVDNSQSCIVSSSNEPVVLHGIDACKSTLGYVCLCGLQFTCEDHLYKHFKLVLAPAPELPLPSHSKQLSWSDGSQASKKMTMLVCSICQERYFRWAVFRYHTVKKHHVYEFERFEKKDRNESQ